MSDDFIEMAVLAVGGLAAVAIAWSILNSLGLFSGAASVQNAESWDIQRDENGMLSGITIHRNVH